MDEMVNKEKLYQYQESVRKNRYNELLEILNSYQFSDELREEIKIYLQYKSESNTQFIPNFFRYFLNQTLEQIDIHGEDDVVSFINETIASGYDSVNYNYLKTYTKLTLEIIDSYNFRNELNNTIIKYSQYRRKIGKSLAPESMNLLCMKIKEHADMLNDETVVWFIKRCMYKNYRNIDFDWLIDIVIDVLNSGRVIDVNEFNN